MYTEDDLLRFLKPYKSVFNASVCTQAVDQADVTFWVYDRGQWFRHDGGVPQSNRSWCHAFFKTVLGLNQTEYETAKKRLFAGEDLTGVYKSGNSYAVVYRPSTTLSRAHIAALVAGSLVAGSVGLAAKRKFQKKPTTSANKAPKHKDVVRLEALFQEFLAQYRKDEQIDPQKITEYMTTFKQLNTNRIDIPDPVRDESYVVEEIFSQYDLQNINSIIQGKFKDIYESEPFKYMEVHKWNHLGSTYRDTLQDKPRADKILAAMHFAELKRSNDLGNNGEGESGESEILESGATALKELWRKSADPVYRNAIDEFIAGSPDAVKAKCYILLLWFGMSSGRGVDEKTLNALKAIVETLPRQQEFRDIRASVETFDKLKHFGSVLSKDAVEIFNSKHTFNYIIDSDAWKKLEWKNLDDLAHLEPNRRKPMLHKVEAAALFQDVLLENPDNPGEINTNSLKTLVRLVIENGEPYASALDELIITMNKNNEDISKMVTQFTNELNRVEGDPY
jgi:hypothetical protein